MDKEYFVKKVEFLCLQKGIKPTTACKESGLGTSFLPDIKRGRIPSVDKFEKLAAYLGVTTSDLLGEVPPKASLIPEHPYLVMRYDKLSKEDQEDVMAYIEFKVTQAAKKEKQQKAEKPDVEE